MTTAYLGSVCRGSCATRGFPARQEEMPDCDFLGRMILRSSRSVRSTSRASWTRLKSRLSYAAERRVDRLWTWFWRLRRWPCLPQPGGGLTFALAQRAQHGPRLVPSDHWAAVEQAVNELTGADGVELRFAPAGLDALGDDLFRWVRLHNESPGTGLNGFSAMRGRGARGSIWWPQFDRIQDDRHWQSRCRTLW